MPATFEDAAWRANPGAVRDALEANQIVCYPVCPLPLPPEDTLDFLRRELPQRFVIFGLSKSFSARAFTFTLLRLIDLTFDLLPRLEHVQTFGSD